MLALCLAGAPVPLYAQTVTHTVQPGETLSEIAEQYNTTEAMLLELNDLDAPDTILVGQQLMAPAPLAPAGPGQHRVQVGETLSEIAKQYGVPLAQLMAANGITNPDSVYIGQLLVLPAIAAESQPTPTSATVQPTEAVQPTETPSSELSSAPPDFYTVAPGDTLLAIARRFEIDVDALRVLNDIGDADTILVGQTLRLAGEAPLNVAPEPTLIPTFEAATVAPTSPAESATDAPMLADAAATAASSLPVELPAELSIERSGNPIGSLNRTYQVRFGDTLNLIALRTGVDAESLRRLNRFNNLNAALNAGQQLILPATGDELRPRTPAREVQVKPGESLSGIAAEHGVTLAALLQVNRIADPNAVYPGQALLIPSAAESNPSTALRKQIGAPRSGYFYYTVQPGDTMSEIAKSLNTTMLAIQTYNNLPNTETVYNNMELKIPYGPPPLNLLQPPAPTSGTRFVVSLSRQQCWVYQGDRILYSWSCSTGAGERRTKPGNYAVQSKILNAKSNVWKLDMPYWLGIYDVGPYENGVHGLPVAWKTGRKIWSGLIGQPATFGCAMLDDTAASTLFRLAFIGMPVHVIN
ncbi:MAG: LysM peptidoglycan-binding domain-containing protein [Caldilinea sp.]